MTKGGWLDALLQWR